MLSYLIIDWYKSHHRVLPWRETSNPYHIWISEVILQQTRVNQGIGYYYRFLEAFPDVFVLARASEQEVLKVWQGLGYYSRARNLHKAAIDIVENYQGVFPSSKIALLKLKGIGDYTASAIASICFGEAVAVLDGNVARLVSRLFAMTEAVDSQKGKSIIGDIAHSLMDKTNPGVFNQAIMEMGALICKPQNPQCNICPVANLCEALKLNKVLEYPVKLPKRTPSDRFIVYLVIIYKGNKHIRFIMRKRTANDIWKNMFDFPCIEFPNPTEPNFILSQIHTHPLLFDTQFEVKNISREYIHKLTHRTLHSFFVHVELKYEPKLTENLIMADRIIMQELPLPKLIVRYLSTLKCIDE